jgi:hypothetical protein
MFYLLISVLITPITKQCMCIGDKPRPTNKYRAALFFFPPETGRSACEYIRRKDHAALSQERVEFFLSFFEIFP